MRITRKEILKAIRTEKLRGGEFIEVSELMYSDPDSDWDKCKVCAVGAVLRLKGIKSWNIDAAACACMGDWTGYGNYEYLCDSLREKNYMAALSIKFENLYEKYGGGKRTKEKLARFVKVNFPKEIRVKGV